MLVNFFIANSISFILLHYNKNLNSSAFPDFLNYFKAHLTYINNHISR